MNEDMIKGLLAEIAKYRRDIYAAEDSGGVTILSDNIDPKGEYVEWNDVKRILLKKLGGRWG
jgi:hypothetical protein